MSVREIVGRLMEAKNQLGQARTIGVQSAATLAEARAAVDAVLDAVQDKTLSNAIAAKAKAIEDEFNGIEVLFREIDLTIQRTQAIGGGR
jgi:NAD(P)-dependent dehydrogenase (short-subunit alcohol dehydrogenase family)